MNYIDKLFEISNRVGGEGKYEYFIIHHKKHNRTICFRDTKEAIEFIQPKFRHTFFKRIFYRLIKLGLHRWIFDIVVLSKNLGDVIYIANRTKSFDLKEKKVISFKNSMEELSNDFQLQVFLSKYGFAPKILALCEKGLYLKEELLNQTDLTIGQIAKRLAQFHRLTEYRFIHGDFVKDHILVDNKGNIKFIDWNIRQGNPTEDVLTFIEESQ
jgi:hypothetical protein